MQMEKSERFTTATDPLLVCSLCRCLLQEAVLLKCLHNCCRQCFSTASVEDRYSGGVRCNTCSVVTQVGSEKPNGFIGFQVQRYKMIAESRTCSKCKENGEHDKPALVWCPTCRLTLCGECMTVHRQFYRQHVTQSLEELPSLEEVCSERSTAACGIHGKPLDIVCLNCEEAKCISCWESCKEAKHEVHTVGEKSFDRYVRGLLSGISSIESELLLKSAVLENPKCFLRDTKAARDRHLENLKERKCRIMDAVEEVYEKTALYIKDAYDDIEAEGVAAAKAADRIGLELSDAQSYIRRLVESNEKCEVFKQQKMLRERLSVLSAELDDLSHRLFATTEVKIDASLPENLENVVGAWIGVARTYSVSASPPPSTQQQQQQSFSFGPASASFELPVDCWDVALSKDGRSLLLAAQQHGLIELSSSCGDELSRWRPPKHSSSSSQDDWVVSVAALDDGRAAVSLHYAQRIVLLRRSDKVGSSTGRAAAAAAAAAGDGTWIEERRMDALSWPARFLSAHGDLLAASEWRRIKQTNKWQPGQRLQLLSLGSGRRLSAELQREYDICSLAVAADMVITGSREKVELGGGRRTSAVLDAHSVTDDGTDVRLWRHDVNSSSSDNEEEEEWLLLGVCLDPCGGCLYAALWRHDRSSGRITALNLADGSELRRITLSFTAAAAAAAVKPQLLLLPAQLSLCEDGAASAAAAEQQQQSSDGRVLLLAALCWDATTKVRKTVTLHRSTSDVLQ